MKTIATQGVPRFGSTLPSTPGTTPCSAIPYIRREAMIRLIRAPFARAKSAIAEKSRSGTASGPTDVTSSSGALDDASRSTGTTIEATRVTAR